MKSVEVDLEDAKLFCPATGQQILSEEACKPSPATLFIYVEDENVFEFVRPELKVLADKVEETSWLDLENGRPIDSLLSAISSAAAVDFVVKLSGIACGPVSTTVHIGVDLAHGSAAEEP